MTNEQQDAQTMQETFWQTMERCADIIAKITPADVLDAQSQLLKEGLTLEQVTRVDRALLAEQFIRSCVIESRKRAGVKNG